MGGAVEGVELASLWSSVGEGNSGDVWLGACSPREIGGIKEFTLCV